MFISVIVMAARAKVQVPNVVVMPTDDDDLPLVPEPPRIRRTNSLKTVVGPDGYLTNIEEPTTIWTNEHLAWMLYEIKEHLKKKAKAKPPVVELHGLQREDDPSDEILRRIHTLENRQNEVVQLLQIVRLRSGKQSGNKCWNYLWGLVIVAILIVSLLDVAYDRRLL